MNISDKEELKFGCGACALVGCVYSLYGGLIVGVFAAIAFVIKVLFF